METKHTVGNWKINNEFAKITKNSKANWYSINDENDRTIVEVKGNHYGVNDNECFANAKLIAAAPELLESLIEIRKWYEENQTKILKNYTPVCFSKALSVILKATQ